MKNTNGGLLVILWPKDGGTLGNQRILADAIYMITGFSWAYYNVKGKELMARHPPLDATAVAGFAGTICLSEWGERDGGF